MPPLLFVVLSTPMTKLAHMIFPTAMANGVIAGSFTFCKRAHLLMMKSFLIVSNADVLYDVMHYA